jgi:predicted transcriptional regulator
MEQQSLIEYVLRSGARTAVLQAIADGCETTQLLLNRNLASESAVYNALTELENRDLIHSPRTKRWAPTGIRSIVSTFVHEQRQTERVLQIDTDYWKRHDVTVLPSDSFRLTDLTGGTVVRATDTHPSRAVREVERRLESTTAASVIAPIFNERYSDALLDGNGDSRLILATDVFHSLLDNTDTEVDNDLNVRVTDVEFALTVTDDSVLLSLPLLDGSYDTQTEFVVDSEHARRKGIELFESIWDDAKPADEYVESFDTNDS